MADALVDKRALETNLRGGEPGRALTAEPVRAAGRSRAMPHQEVHDLGSLLGVLEDKIDEDAAAGAGNKEISVEEVMKLIGRRAYGPLLLIIGLISISPASLLPGSTTVFATITLLIAVQLALHKDRPWMPKAALRMKLSEEKLDKFIKLSRPTANFVDHFIRPRLEFLADPPWVMGIALLVVVAALVTYPLSFIPIAPLLPGLAVVFFGLGLTARDGLLLALGAGVMGVGLWLIFSRLL